MKRIVLAVLIALVTFSSCRKQETVDYSGPLTLYRVGDTTFIIPAEESDIYFRLFKRPSEYLFEALFKADYLPDSFMLEMHFICDTPLKKGDVVTPTEVMFANPIHIGDLGYTRAIESGKILYLGDEGDKSLFRFEDLTFKVTRRDESGITDTYQIRGIAKALK